MFKKNSWIIPNALPKILRLKWEWDFGTSWLKLSRYEIPVKIYFCWIAETERSNVHTSLLVKSTRWSTPLPSAAPRFACRVSVDTSWKVDARLNEETLDQSASSARPSWSQDMNTWWNGSNCLGASLRFPGGLQFHFERQYRPFLSKQHLLSNAALVSTICNISRNHYILTMKP